MPLSPAQDQPRTGGHIGTCSPVCQDAFPDRQFHFGVHPPAHHGYIWDVGEIAMTQHPPVLFFSDAHLGAHSPVQEAVKVERLVGFLQHASEIRAEVFFLGDLFDFWFEYRHWMPKAPLRILSAILQFTRGGGTFHVLLGNHDIWAADYFSRELGVQMHRGDLSITRNGLRLLISHGDGKARSDRGYRILKRILRFKPNVSLFRLLPADWAYGLANFFSRRSRQLTASRPPRFLPEYEEVAATSIDQGYDAVVMGHIHQACVKRLGNGWWVNSGEFFERFSYVRLQGQEFVLEEWNPAVNTAAAKSE
jgi:UDP-2,3-diacylglucosamine hydrolase